MRLVMQTGSIFRKRMGGNQPVGVMLRTTAQVRLITLGSAAGEEEME